MPPMEECYSSDETSEDNCVGTVALDSLKEGRKRDCFARKISSERYTMNILTPNIEY